MLIICISWFPTHRKVSYICANHTDGNTVLLEPTCGGGFVFPFSNCHMLDVLDEGMGEGLEYSPTVAGIPHLHIYSLLAKRTLHKSMCVKREGTVRITFSCICACWQSHRRAPLAAAVTHLGHFYFCVSHWGTEIPTEIPTCQKPSNEQPITTVQETPAFVLLKHKNF